MGLFKEDVDIKGYTTLGIGGRVRRFGVLADKAEIPAFCEEAERLGLPLAPLGGGSNVVFADGMVERAVLKIELAGFEADCDVLRVGAGEEWDSVVERSVTLGLSGLEPLSAIPGTAGATPIQNVGAYGRETADVLLELEAYDRKIKRFMVMGKEDCGFGYRSSVFKRDPGRYLVTEVRYKLSNDEPEVPEYPGVRRHLEELGIRRPSLADIRQAIRSIRAAKLPDPKVLPNAGSFFKNPYVSADQAESIKEAHPDCPQFPEGGLVKIPAGWLVERAGFKGKDLGPIGVYEKNALVLVNRGGARQADLEKVRDEIVSVVECKFGVRLEQEPVTIL